MSGLTLGKLEAIRNGLDRLKKVGEYYDTEYITILEEELLRDLEFHFKTDEILKTENMFK